MERSVLLTKDGSHTISVPAMNVTYHSLHGAIQESMHVFINAGLHQMVKQQNPCIKILEMGFGTGLNAFLTLIESEKLNQNTHYTTIELYPLQEEEAASLNYCEQLERKDLSQVFEQLHRCEWEKEIAFTPFFTLKKIRTNLINLSTPSLINLVYFDAFAPAAQPELWTKQVFEKLIKMMAPAGILVTYCSKGDVRRALQAAGFLVEKIPGPPGKREMVRARKPE